MEIETPLTRRKGCPGEVRSGVSRSHVTITRCSLGRLRRRGPSNTPGARFPAPKRYLTTGPTTGLCEWEAISSRLYHPTMILKESMSEENSIADTGRLSFGSNRDRVRDAHDDTGYRIIHRRCLADSRPSHRSAIKEKALRWNRHSFDGVCRSHPVFAGPAHARAPPRGPDYRDIPDTDSYHRMTFPDVANC